MIQASNNLVEVGTIVVLGYASVRVSLRPQAPIGSIVSDVVTAVPHNVVACMQRTQHQLADLTVPNGWKRPSRTACARALDLIAEIATLAQFMPPNVTTSPGGDVVLEWWHAQKKLTIYVDDAKYGLLRVWGSNIDSEMDDHEYTDPHDIRWAYLWMLES